MDLSYKLDEEFIATAMKEEQPFGSLKTKYVSVQIFNSIFLLFSVLLLRQLVVWGFRLGLSTQVWKAPSIVGYVKIYQHLRFYSALPPINFQIQDSDPICC